jgi:hypothetical protein
MATWSRKDMRKLFLAQLRTLRSFKIPPAVILRLKPVYETVVEKASQMKIDTGRIPFLPVIPRTYEFFSPYGDLPITMHCGDKVGGSLNLSPELINDSVVSPYEPYYIFDIQDGSATLGMSPTEALRNWPADRRPLTDGEIIALATHTDVLSRFNICAYSSSYDDGKDIDLRVDENGYPALYSNNRDLDWNRWAIPMCSNEVVWGKYDYSNER